MTSGNIITNKQGDVFVLSRRPAHVALAIQDAVMAGEDQREKLIAEQVVEINRLARLGETTGLGLDNIGGDALPVPDVQEAPLTMPELERAVLTSHAFGGRFRPHPTLGGAHVLDWHGQDHEVTFSPVQFDEHPNTLRLLSYGSSLLDEILGAVEPPQEAESGGRAARCLVGPPTTLIGYYGPGREGAPTTITTLGSLRKCLEGGPGDPSIALLCPS